MIILGREELKDAESVLKQLFPESIKVYGCIFNINRGTPHNLEIVADKWPDFSVIICTPKVKGVKDREGDFNMYSIYSNDKDALKHLLKTPGVIDTDAFTLLAGVDIRHLAAVQEFADEHGIPWKVQCVMNVLMLQDTSHLCLKESYARLRFPAVSTAHAHLVNSTWKYGGDANSYNSVLNYITHNPSVCIVEEDRSEPVSWLLLYQHCALGLLYTLPQHRRKGYAKLLVSIMSQNLLERGYPVYCFVEEENEPSHKLFSSLGFKHSSDYRSVWFELNKREET
ncbi:glycine N-acyltransferase-like protein 3 [Triplophysa dalaica]|uniref:glycine N-acyltransferase-like protein 3 n=1 Tax=Triplophysa dalaica TaxID=1582913 RepID=UPI0024E0303D|nr:glycine N-acyltransferase-like protein 3 [Triplophysa dalaica]